MCRVVGAWDGWGLNQAKSQITTPEERDEENRAGHLALSRRTVDLSSIPQCGAGGGGGGGGGEDTWHHRQEVSDGKRFISGEGAERVRVCVCVCELVAQQDEL